MLATEAIYIEQNNRRMHEITDDLFFVIDEKHNSIELTDKGIDLISSDVDDPMFFVLPDVGSEVAAVEASNLSEGEKTAISFMIFVFVSALSSFSKNPTKEV